MTLAPDPIAVATHWPYVRRNLTLSRARPAQLALDSLAELQFRATGEHVRLGRARLRSEFKLTAGEAGAVYNALCELERRGAVTRVRDAGSRPHRWGFQPDLRRWRAMAWRTSGRSVGDAIGACICSTHRAFAARNPGHGLVEAPQFWLSDDDHLRPPGLFLVDSRGKRATRAANARRPGEMLVDSRGYHATSSAEEDPVLLLKRLNVSLELSDEERDRLDLLRGAVGAPIMGRIGRDLEELAKKPYSDMQIAAARAALDQKRMSDGSRPGVPLRAAMLAELLDSPAIRMLEA